MEKNTKPPYLNTDGMVIFPVHIFVLLLMWPLNPHVRTVNTPNNIRYTLRCQKIRFVMSASLHVGIFTHSDSCLTKTSVTLVTVRLVVTWLTPINSPITSWNAPVA